MATIIQLRRDETVNWVEADPILADGEMGWEKTGTEITAYKVGDGIRKWSELPYASNVSILQELGQSETAVVSQKVVTNTIEEFNPHSQRGGAVFLYTFSSYRCRSQCC